MGGTEGNTVGQEYRLCKGYETRERIVLGEWFGDQCGCREGKKGHVIMGPELTVGLITEFELYPDTHSLLLEKLWEAGMQI